MIDHFACWLDLPWAIVDVETTGYQPSYAKIVELAIVRMRGGKVERTWTSLVNPGIHIPSEVTRLHGIDNFDVRNAPRFVETLLATVPLLDGALPVAYNENFDRRFLLSELTDSGFDAISVPALSPEWRWVDPCMWVRSLDRFVEDGKASNTLEAACRRWGVTFTGDSHRALPDAIATGELLWAMGPEIGRMTASELLRRQALLSKRKSSASPTTKS